MTAGPNKIPPLIATGTILIIFTLDQITKNLVTRNIPYRGEIPILPGLLNLVYIRNRGAAFGLGSGTTGEIWPALLLGLTLIATVFVIYLLFRTIRHSWLVTFALSLILGGALGNLSDRIRTGSVVDFLDFHLSAAHWPSFNLADASITIGGILLLLHLLVPAPHPSESVPPPEHPAALPPLRDDSSSPDIIDPHS